MTKGTMIKNYRKYAAHDAYIIGIERGAYLFMIVIRELMPRWIRVTREAMSKGGGKKIKLYINAHDRDLLIKTSGICLGKTKEVLPLNRFKNKGDAFECLITELCGLTYEKPNSIGFWHDGDLDVGGIKYQIKYNTASIVAEKTLETLKVFDRYGETPPAEFKTDIQKQVERMKSEHKKRK